MHVSNESAPNWRFCMLYLSIDWHLILGLREYHNCEEDDTGRTYYVMGLVRMNAAMNRDVPFERLACKETHIT